MRSSDKFDKLINADLRTPPTTTTSAILHTTSCASIEDSLRPAAFLKTLTVKFMRDSSGSGPLARPPNVLRGAPAGLTFDKSQRGICPTYNIPISSFSAFAQPNLESATVIVVSVSKNSSAIVGNCETY